MRLLTVDLETTGLDTDSCEVIELGFALYDLEMAGEAPILMRSNLVLAKEELSEEIVQVTGIKQTTLDCFGISPEEAFLEFVDVINTHKPEYIVGHNIVDYDLPIIKRYLDFLNPYVSLTHNSFVIDTRIDLHFDTPPKSNSLIYLCADKASFVNPFPHRALLDALSTMKLLFKFDISKVTEKARSPIIEVRADVSFQNKDLAKKAGYGWDGDRKIWIKKIREASLFEENRKSSFPVIVLGKGKNTTLL